MMHPEVRGMKLGMTWPQYRRGECSVTQTIRLTRAEAEIVATLLLRCDPVPVSDLIEAIYPDPDREPDSAKKRVQDRMFRLMRKLPGAIDCVHGRGYRMQERA